jgi:hypothetical protein
MVHALYEAHRVLRRNGLLIDLRPAAEHRRVGITQADGYSWLGVMREKFDDDRAADRAVRQVESDGRFKAEGRTQFTCQRIMDTLDEFQGWLTDFVSRDKLPSHEWLVRRVERELNMTNRKTRIVVSGPLFLRALRKQESVRDK